MELNVFKKCVHKCLKERDFVKIKSKYYMTGEEFTCMIDIQKSCYEPKCYINYSFFLGKFKSPSEINKDEIATYTPCVVGRFYFTGKDTYSCDYLNYLEDELVNLLDNNLKEKIFPPFEEGKNYLLKHFGTLYKSFLNDDIIKPLLEK